MRLPDWTPDRKTQPQDLVDAILARRGGSLLNLDRALLWSEPLARGWNVYLKAVRTELPTSCTLSDVVRLTTINAAQLQCSTVNSPLNAAHPPVVEAEDERSYHHFESRPCRIILVVHAYEA